MNSHIFVDESKSNGVLMVAACYLTKDVDEVRAKLIGLLLPGQERLHFKSERDARRSQIIESLIECGTAAIAVRAPVDIPAHAQRERCIESLISEAARLKVERFVIELDDSVFEFDRRVLFRLSRSKDLNPGFSYSWLRARQEPLLWAADALAWSLARGGRWRQRVSTIVEFIDLNSG